MPRGLQLSCLAFVLLRQITARDVFFYLLFYAILYAMLNDLAIRSPPGLPPPLPQVHGPPTPTPLVDRWTPNRPLAAPNQDCHRGRPPTDPSEADPIHIPPLPPAFRAFVPDRGSPPRAP